MLIALLTSNVGGFSPFPTSMHVSASGAAAAQLKPANEIVHGDRLILSMQLICVASRQKFDVWGLMSCCESSRRTPILECGTQSEIAVL